MASPGLPLTTSIRALSTPGVTASKASDKMATAAQLSLIVLLMVPVRSMLLKLLTRESTELRVRSSVLTTGGSL